jgi:hypothetical protein
MAITMGAIMVMGNDGERREGLRGEENIVVAGYNTY